MKQHAKIKIFRAKLTNYLQVLMYACVLGFVSSANLASGFELHSTSFRANEFIPQQYSSCEGQANISPQLSWHNVPENTRSFVLIVNDPDAANHNWVHWLLFNIPSYTNSFAESTRLPLEATSGLNSWRTSGYSGPCPPTGAHRYYFRLYALDTVLQLSTTAQYQNVVDAMQGHILGEAVLMGRYSR